MDTTRPDASRIRSHRNTVLFTASLLIAGATIVAVQLASELTRVGPDASGLAILLAAVALMVGVFLLTRPDAETEAGDARTDATTTGALRRAEPGAVAERERVELRDLSHPFGQVVVGLVREHGFAAVRDALDRIRPDDPTEAFVRLLHPLLGDRTARRDLELHLTSITFLDSLVSDETRREQWGATPERLTTLLSQVVSRAADAALALRSAPALAHALMLLARPIQLGGNPDDARIARIKTLLAQHATERDAAEIARIRSGDLDASTLDALAVAALEQERGEVFLEASLSALTLGSSPIVERTADAIGAVQLARTLAEQLPAAALERAAHVIARHLLPQLDTEIDRALAGLDEAGATLERAIAFGSGHPAAREESRQARTRLKNLSILRAMLATVALPPHERVTQLQQELVFASQLLASFERRDLSEHDANPVIRGRALGRLAGLRAARDAIEDALHPLLPDTSTRWRKLNDIFDVLNGRWLHASDPCAVDFGRPPYGTGTPGARSVRDFRVNGLRQQRDAARRRDAGRPASPETRRLEEAVAYWEERRVELIFAEPKWRAFDELARIEQVEAGCAGPWDGLRSLADETESERIASIARRRTRDLPVLLAEMDRASGASADSAAYLEELRAKDLVAGAKAWAAYYATRRARDLVLVNARARRGREIRDRKGELADAVLFGLFNRTSDALLHGIRFGSDTLEPDALAAEVAQNLTRIGGLRALDRFFASVERALVARGEAAAALARGLRGLARTDRDALFEGDLFETAKRRAAAFGARGAGGDDALEPLVSNLVLLSELRATHPVGNRVRGGAIVYDLVRHINASARAGAAHDDAPPDAPDRLHCGEAV